MVGNLVPKPKIVVWKIVDHFDARAPFFEWVCDQSKGKFCTHFSNYFLFFAQATTAIAFLSKWAPPFSYGTCYRINGSMKIF